MKGHSPTAVRAAADAADGAACWSPRSLSGNADLAASGRYKPFPIAGTAIMTVARLPALAARGRHADLGRGRRTWCSLGLGLGMVMQVLVLAVQNAVDYRFLGVATSGSTLFRQIGGSIGVAAFGAIFANRLGDELAARLPAGAHVPTVANPAVIRACRRRSTRRTSRPSPRRSSRSSWPRAGSRWSRFAAHVVAARGAAAQRVPDGGPRRELRLAAGRRLGPRARADRVAAHARRRADARLPGDDRARRGRHPARRELGAGTGRRARADDRRRPGRRAPGAIPGGSRRASTRWSPAATCETATGSR